MLKTEDYRFWCSGQSGLMVKPSNFPKLGGRFLFIPCFDTGR